MRRAVRYLAISGRNPQTHITEIFEALRAPGPDGRAAVCKTAEAGSAPAGASHRLPRRSASRGSPQDRGQDMGAELVD